MKINFLLMNDSVKNLSGNSQCRGKDIGFGPSGTVIVS